MGYRQDSTYYGLCYTSRGALAGTRNSSMGPPHEGSIRRPIAQWAKALSTELHIASIACMNCLVKIYIHTLPSLHWICPMPSVVYPIMILNIVSTDIFSALGKIIGMVRLRTSFILSSQSWEIGSPPTGVQEGWSCLVSYPHRAYTSDSFIYLEERSSTSVWALSVYSDSSPHFGGVQSRKERYIW